MIATCPHCGTPEIGGACSTRRRAMRHQAMIEAVLTVVVLQLAAAAREVEHHGANAEDFPALVRLGSSAWN